jgi:signal transduction histidine kinase
MAMNPFAVPSLLSTILLSALGIILYLQNPKERINKIFSALMFVSALSNISAFIFHLATTEPAARFWTKIPYLFALPSQVLGLYYVLILTGIDKRMGERLFGLPVKVHLWAIGAGNALLLGLLVFSDSVIAGVEVHPVTGYEHTYGPLFVVTALYFSYVGTVELVLMFRGYRRSNYWLEKVWLKYNIVGFVIIFVAGGILALYLPLQGIPTHSFTFIPFTIAAFIFYYALLRHHIGQIQELNENLEQKVDERTRELRAAQAQLIQSEKMASLGQLVAGLAHEINSPLGSINSNTDIIDRSVKKVKELLSPSPPSNDNSKLPKILDTLEQINDINKIACERIGALVISLKHFARLDEAEYQLANINDCIEETLVLLHHKLKNRIAVIKEFGELPEIECMPRKLNQVFMNLLVNAIQAIEGKGSVTLKTYRENGTVVIKIKDTGAGISKENLDKIFDPGFTTKGSGVGTGLGLPICYNIIIEEHGGKIYVQSEVGKGTEITLELNERRRA